jgi:hypothetical protein
VNPDCIRGLAGVLDACSFSRLASPPASDLVCPPCVVLCRVQQHLVLLQHESVADTYERFLTDSDLDAFLNALTTLADDAPELIQQAMEVSQSVT